MEKRLISMTDFVIQQRKELLFKPLGKACCKYADFLKQPLTLGMFVPCDLQGNVMMSIDEKEQWFRDKYDNGWWNEFVEYKKQYNEAKERVLFKGCEYKGQNDEVYFIKLEKSKTAGYLYTHIYKDGTIESLFDLELTESAIKQIGL